MAKEGFVDVTTSDSGKTYKMPDAEYTGSAADRATAFKEAKAAAPHAVLVTQSNGRTWEGLDPA